ncbi:multisubunit Na+/H+ antiporter, MnhG subunit [Opitutaceae bacterium TAV1]|nr:multisubunit Na+/H+ antiporter, MnhG subunit [Opitutaceae bacterium TAV1]
MMTQVLHTLSAIITLLGALVILVAIIGLAKLPDVFCRAHALGKGMTLGLVLLLTGLWIDLGSEVAGLKIPAAIFFQFLTLPVASHLAANLSFRKKLPRFGDPRVDKDRRSAGPRR